MIRLVERDKSVLGKANKTKWEHVFKEFVATGAAVSEIVYSPGEYTSPKVLRSVGYVAAKKSVYPVTVVGRKDKVYLVRTDM